MNNDFEQGLAGLRDTMPRIWWSIYQGCRAVGFDERQSFAALTAYILSQNPAGIRPDNVGGPKPEQE